MSTQHPLTLPSLRLPVVDASRTEHSLQAFADTALKATTRLLFLVILIGQLVFAFTVASFYGMPAARGDLQAWNRSITQGHVPGDTIGNLAVAMHLASAVIIILAGLMQLVPQIRQRAPSLHRWTGRLYIAAAFSISIAGLYMLWVHGTVGDLAQHLGVSLQAVLIMLCAVMALRHALARDFKTHRRWALRLYLVVSASLFIRAALFLSLLINRAPFGFDPTTGAGPFLTFISYAQYLLPLAVLELYLRIQERGGAPGRLAMAGGLLVLTVGLGAGLLAVSAAIWVPKIKQAYDSRTSIAQTLSATLGSSGIDEAAKQYHDLKAASLASYNFDEAELNALGYELLRAKKLPEAIRIFQLNVEAYPQSSNAYDSLAEAYVDDGNQPQGIANYQKALELNPKNGNSAVALQKLTAR
jgi:uncharacterized membrane protein